ncbi:DNA-directed RNA polymerase subunit beta' [Ruminococcaceae bacterium YRB3002]|nr:DNA-directed RNA polymerase subunit beta' [Ruminococcaceae bacterium YRB3002]
MNDTNHLTQISISLASPEVIKGWSHGEVKKPETINYRTQKPETDGLFCEKIFGPTKSWECHCGKYKKIRFKGMTCDKCGVEVTKNTVRRERMGHIELATPVSHLWYFKGIPSRMSILLDIPPKKLEKVLYYAAYLVIDPGKASDEISRSDIIDEVQYRDLCARYGRSNFDARMGAEAVKIMLQQVDLDKLSEELNEERELVAGSVQKKAKIIKRLEVVEAFKTSGNKPEWMILDVLPVLPPELRPMVPLDGGRYATSDLNDLYRRVINRNNRLRKLLELGAPDIIVRNEKRMLQEAVDSLIDNGRRGRAVTGSTSATSNRQLKSLTDMLKGKQGRFRQNLLGKRVDYSGRSVIIVGPELKMHQCGLPKEMALELFKPFVIKKLVEQNDKLNIKTARKLVDRADPKVWDILEDIIKDHPVLLNRAPTLHRLGIQAFEPILVEGRAIKLHPLVCTAFNADFDGDQMAVHVPLSAEAQAEARFLMLSTNNLLKPQDGKPVTVPTQDMILGCYYLTIDHPGVKGEGMIFSSIDEAFMAYGEHQLDLHAEIKVRVSKEIDGETVTGIVTSTLGRFIFNQIVPQNLGYVDRTVEADPSDPNYKGDSRLVLECDFIVDKKKLEDIISRCIAIQGTEKTTIFLDAAKELGYKYSTISGLSIGIKDMIIPDIKDRMIKEADEKVDLIMEGYRRGLLRESERHKAVTDLWEETTNKITKELMSSLDRYNSIKMMADSGARGSQQQIKQLAGMRGLMNDTSGNVIEIPIRSNLREGMNVIDFFISSHGARKALSDTALKTADSGYLTRRLVDVSQEVVITEDDCGTEDFTWVKEITTIATDSDGNIKQEIIKPLRDRLYGRYAAAGADVINPVTGEVMVKGNELITSTMAAKIEKAVHEAQAIAKENGKSASEIEAIGKIKIRSVFDCQSRHGVCAKCYGINLATAAPASAGEAVGIMAAQSIGEPGTQLTMRTFHSGGIASGDDITQGLPRVEELFEARTPKGEAIISQIDGIVSVEKGEKGKREFIVRSVLTGDDADEIRMNDKGEPITEVRYAIPLHSTISVKPGDHVEAGQALTDGNVNPNKILKIKDIRAVQRYIVNEVTKVYKHGGVSINDKHIEIITRQMMRRVKIENPGDTGFMTGTTVDWFDFLAANKRCEEEGKAPAVGKRQLLGVTKAALATDSFLSAASFQETARVLTDAAVKGKVDPLIGLKENVIIGSLIPAGTGLAAHRDITAVPVIKANAKLITGEEYDENSEDAEMFENEYLDEVNELNEKLDATSGSMASEE